MTEFASHLREDTHRLERDFRALSEDMESLLRHAAHDTGEGIDKAREHLARRATAARARIAQLDSSLRDAARRTGRATVDYSKQHPWQVAGIAIGVVALVAWLARRED